MLRYFREYFLIILSKISKKQKELLQNICLYLVILSYCKKRPTYVSVRTYDYCIHLFHDPSYVDESGHPCWTNISQKIFLICAQNLLKRYAFRGVVWLGMAQLGMVSRYGPYNLVHKIFFVHLPFLIIYK